MSFRTVEHTEAVQNVIILIVCMYVNAKNHEKFRNRSDNSVKTHEAHLKLAHRIPEGQHL